MATKSNSAGSKASGRPATSVSRTISASLVGRGCDARFSFRCHAASNMELLSNGVRSVIVRQRRRQKLTTCGRDRRHPAGTGTARQAQEKPPEAPETRIFSIAVCAARCPGSSWRRTALFRTASHAAHFELGQNPQLRAVVGEDPGDQHEHHRTSHRVGGNDERGVRAEVQVTLPGLPAPASSAVCAPGAARFRFAWRRDAASGTAA